MAHIVSKVEFFFTPLPSMVVAAAAAAASNLLHTKNQNQINKPHFNYLTQMKKK